MGNLGLVLMGGAVLPPCFLACGQTMVVLMVVMATSFKSTYASTVLFSAPDPVAGHCHPHLCWRLPALPGKSGSVSCGVTAPFFCVLVHTRFCCALQESQSCGSSEIKSHQPSKSNSLGVLSLFAKFPGWEIHCGP